MSILVSFITFCWCTPFDLIACVWEAFERIIKFKMQWIPCGIQPASNPVDSRWIHTWFSIALCWSKGRTGLTRSVLQTEASAECWSRIRLPSTTPSLIITQPDGELILDQWLWSVSYKPLGLSSVIVKEALGGVWFVSAFLNLLIKTWFTAGRPLSGLFSQSMALIIQLKL